MPEKKGKEKTSPKIEQDVLVLRNTRLEHDLGVLSKELEFTKKKLLEIEAGYKTRVASNIKLDIQNLLGVDDPTLAKLTKGKSVEELENMLNHLVIAQDAGLTVTEKSKQTFKPIRAVGDAVAGDTSGMTVGSLYGKTPEEIRKMGGKF